MEGGRGVWQEMMYMWSELKTVFLTNGMSSSVREELLEIIIYIKVQNSANFPARYFLKPAIFDVFLHS